MIVQNDLGLKGPGIAIFASNILVSIIQGIWAAKTEEEFEPEGLIIHSCREYFEYVKIGSATLINQTVQFIALEIIFLLAVKFSTV